LVADPLAMLISGTCLAAVFTFLLRETFDIHPAASLGYSLGEISMMFASGVWTKADEMALALRKSPLFHNRLAGSQDAVREFWGKNSSLPEMTDGRLWANFILMAPYEKVAEALKGFNHVYITHINTPRQVVIGGQPDECRQLIAALKCSSLEAPFNYALHCEAMESEYESLRELHTWQVQNQPGMTLYSAATDGPMPIEQDAIARQIAYGLCHRLDFTKLVDTVYEGGARIFIELGAGSNCTRWVDESLAGKPHSAFPINRKGIDDHSAILQMLARLVTHGVPVNLSPIYG
jgi:PfaB family protein